MRMFTPTQTLQSPTCRRCAGRLARTTHAACPGCMSSYHQACLAAGCATPGCPSGTRSPPAPARPSRLGEWFATVRAWALFSVTGLLLAIHLVILGLYLVADQLEGLWLLLPLFGLTLPPFLAALGQVRARLRR